MQIRLTESHSYWVRLSASWFDWLLRNVDCWESLCNWTAYNKHEWCKKSLNSVNLTAVDYWRRERRRIETGLSCTGFGRKTLVLESTLACFPLDIIEWNVCEYALEYWTASMDLEDKDGYRTLSIHHGLEIIS